MAVDPRFGSRTGYLLLIRLCGADNGPFTVHVRRKGEVTGYERDRRRMRRGYRVAAVPSSTTSGWLEIKAPSACNTIHFPFFSGGHRQMFPLPGKRQLMQTWRCKSAGALRAVATQVVGRRYGRHPHVGRQAPGDHVRFPTPAHSPTRVPAGAHTRSRDVRWIGS
jgi:hypothetical protein